MSIAICLVIVFVGRENFLNFLFGASKNKVSISALQMDLAKIKIREGDVWSSLPQSFDKNSIDAVSGHLQSHASVGDIFSYYRKTLPLLGWIEAGVKDRNGEQTIKFCKNAMSLNIVASRDDAGIDYYLGVAWAASNGLDAYCPQSNE